MHPHATISHTPADIQRFWALVDKTDTCWLWRGSVNRDGYGLFRPRGNTQHRLAHRIAWLWHHGLTDTRACILHHCDNRRCVRPTHLFSGTRAVNIADCRAKGRLARGETNGQSRLTAGDVLEIRRLCASGIPQLTVAGQFGIGQPNVQAIVSRRSWQHVP